MIKLKNVLLVVLVICLSTLNAYSKISKKEFLKTENLIAAGKTITTNIYPDASYVLIDDYQQSTYQPSGKSVTWDDYCYKILTEKGKRALRTLTHSFNVSYGTGIITKVEIIKPEGKIIPVNLKKQGNISIDSSSMGMNIYDPNNKVIKINIPGLEVGDMVRAITYSKTENPAVKGVWYDIAILENSSPIKKYTYEVIAPKKRPLKHTLLKGKKGDTVTYTKTPSGNTTKHKWVAKDVPQVFPESGMPFIESVQRVLVSTVGNWKGISKWYYNLSKPRVDAVTPEMKEKVEELIDGLETEEEKTRAIFKYVSQKIRYLGLTLETNAPGLEPHDAKYTFKCKSGVCRDKGTLLTSMLKMAGLDAHSVLVHAGDYKKDPVVPNTIFSHLITCVKYTNGVIQFMDPTDETTKELMPAYMSNKSYLIASEKGEPLGVTPVSPAENNLVLVETEAEYDDEGNLTASSDILYEGLNDNAFRAYFSKLDADEIQRFYEAIVKNVAPGAKLTTCEVSPDDMMETEEPLKVHLEFTAPNVLVVGKEKVMVPLPKLGTAVGLVQYVLLQNAGLEKRKYPMRLPYTSGVKEKISLKTGNVVANVVSIPIFPEIDNELLSWKRSIKYEGKKLKYSNEFLSKAVDYTTNDYLKLKENLKEIEISARKRPIFTKNSAIELPEDDLEDDPGFYDTVPGEDVEYEKIDVTYYISNSHNWVVTSDVKKKILTYAGKKDHAELKIYYNPIWEDVKILNAVVTDIDDEKHEISDDAINIMDASWVSSAPRYPAEKILVANLPAVDQDCLIEYKVQHTYKDRPFFATRNTFNASDPVVEEVMKISAPKNMKIDVLLTNEANMEIRGGTIEEGDRTIYKWKVLDQEAMRTENSMPPAYTYCPTIFASSGNWKSYATKVGKAFENASENQVACAAKAAEIVKEAKTEKEKIEAIRNFVAKNIRSAGPAFYELPLSEISKADTTLKDGYGNNADRAILIYTMLKSIGLAPEFVLSSWLSMLDSVAKPLIDFPFASNFGGVLIKLKVDGNIVYLNDTGEYSELGTTPHDKRPALTLPDGKIEIVKAAPDKESKSETKYKCSVSENGDIKIKVSKKYYGSTFAGMKRFFAEMQPDEFKKYKENLVSGMSQSAKLEGDIISDFKSYPGKTEFTVTIPKYAVRENDFLYFVLPQTLGNFLGINSEARENPIYWSSPAKSETVMEISLPKGFNKFELIPPSIEWKAPNGGGTFKSVSKVIPGETPVLKVTYSTDFNAAIIPEMDYGSLLTINYYSHPLGEGNNRHKLLISNNLSCY